MNKNLKKLQNILILAMILVVAMTNCNAEKIEGFENFITVSDNKLMDGDEVFRFISFNIPNLNFVEDEMTFTKVHAYGLPTEWEIRDALESIKQLGGRAVRTYTIPVRKQNEDESIRKYVLAPGKFDEKSFRCMDQMLASANEIGIRLIVPLLNNWKWMGGRPQYADFRGKTEDDFWNDPQLIEDFKKTIEYVLNRKNTITGIKYKDDKSILCWETGNELYSPPEWTVEIVNYIKSIDKNHLVMDGVSGSVIRSESMTESCIDIVTTHHYENSIEKFQKHLRKNIEINNGKKPYVLGEFGFLSTVAMEKMLDDMIDTDISGALIWSLRHHRHDGGFYWHSEPFGSNLYKAYHWPGFPSGADYDEINLLNMMREKAFEIQGKTVPPREIPKPPKLLPINNVAAISWQGSVGASAYDVERAKSKTGPWEKIGYNISDAATQYTPLFHDKSAEYSNKYYYRVIAKNITGNSSPSNVVGPVHVKHLALVDDMNDRSQFLHANGVSIETENDRVFKEDMFRLKGKKESEVIYYVAGDITGFKVYSFSKDDKNVFDFFISDNGEEYKEIKPDSTDYSFGKGDYGYQNPILYESIVEIRNIKYLKIEFNKTAQLSRVEVIYGQ